MLPLTATNRRQALVSCTENKHNSLYVFACSTSSTSPYMAHLRLLSENRLALDRDKSMNLDF